MDIYEQEQSSNLKGVSEVFEKWLQEQSWQIQGIPGFVMMAHRDECTLCKQYIKHAAAVMKKLMVEILSYQIELAFQMVWPQVVTHRRWHCGWSVGCIYASKPFDSSLIYYQRLFSLQFYYQTSKKTYISSIFLVFYWHCFRVICIFYATCRTKVCPICFHCNLWFWVKEAPTDTLALPNDLAAWRSRR